MKFHLSDKEFDAKVKRHIPVRLQSAEQLQITLGKNLRELRLRRNEEQQKLADRAGVSLKTLRDLELGNGSSVETFLRVLKALDSVQVIELIAPRVSVDPLALLLGRGEPQKRVRRKLAVLNEVL